MFEVVAVIRALLEALTRHGARLSRDTRANVAVIFAVTLPLVLGATALVGEYGNALVTEAENQRVADMAAYAGAIAYTKTNSESAMTAAAGKIATLNGVPAASLTVNLVPSPRGSGNNAVRARVALDNPLYLAPILGVPATIRVTAISFAEVGGGAGGCIIALNSALSGVTLSGGTSISAPDCEVASNANITVPCGTSISAVAVAYNSASSPSQPCGGISGPITKKETPDPFDGNADVAAAVARFSTLSGYTAPASPTLAAIAAPATGKNIEFGWNDSTTKAQATALGCTANKSGSTWVFTCPAGGTYNINSFSVGGGLELDFNVGNTATYTFTGNVNVPAGARFGPGDYLFSGNLTTNWSPVSFGAGTYRVRGNMTTNGTTTFGNGDLTVMGNLTTNGTTTFGSGNVSVNGTLVTNGTTKFNENGSGGTYTLVKGINTGGGATTIFGSGTFRMGRSTTACSGAFYSICNTSSLTLQGPSTFELNSGIFNSGGSTLTLGQGTSNSFVVGASSGGNAFFSGGGATTRFGDALGVGSLFRMIGHFDGSAGGGSCIVISAAAEHDIKGNMTIAGGVIMGAGRYTIDGFFALGATGGGASTCSGQTVSVFAENVTIVISGSATPASGDCSGRSFCATAGYSNIRLTSPTSGSMAGFAVIGPQVNGGGALFTGGASGGRISGAFYFPKGPINMNGGAGVAGGTTCLQLIGSLITLAGGTTAVSECVTTAGSGSGGAPRLVQ